MDTEIRSVLERHDAYFFKLKNQWTLVMTGMLNIKNRIYHSFLYQIEPFC